MKSFVAFIIAILMIITPASPVEITESNIADYVAPDCHSVADFLAENFDIFVEEYQKSNPGDTSWQPSHIENTTDITIKDFSGDIPGVLLVFSDDMGYALIGDEYSLYDFQTTGHSPYANITADSFFYSVILGYYYIFNGKEYSVLEARNSDDNFIFGTSKAQSYKGQGTATGCGKITDCSLYVNDKYDGGWSCSSTRSLGMKGYSQWDLSCYVTKSGFSEGNCWAVSAFTVLQYLADTKYSKMPQSTETTNYSPYSSEKLIYTRYYSKSCTCLDKDYVLKDSKDDPNGKKNKSNSPAYLFPELWCDIRRTANSEYGFITGEGLGGNIWQTENLMETVAQKYKCNISVSVVGLTDGAVQNILNDIDKGTPFLFSTSSDTYGSHTMAGCGYKKFTKTTSIWFLKITQTKLFLELRDGHTTQPVWFDLYGYQGLGSLLRVTCK